MGISRHEGGADILTSRDDLYIALGVRIRERPGARWMVEMHPETRADFDLDDFNSRFGSQDVRLYESRYVAPGEYHLLQRGFVSDEEAAAGGPAGGG
jgi:hypothetical protein